MAYNVDTELQNVIHAIKENRLYTFSQIQAFVAPSIDALYDWRFHENHEVRKALADNKIANKVRMINNWMKSENATLQIAAFKLQADAEELERLTVTNATNKNTNENLVKWVENRTYQEAKEIMLGDAVTIPMEAKIEHNENAPQPMPTSAATAEAAQHEADGAG